jgi:DNA-binding transcriptional ArsR family regulator
MSVNDDPERQIARIAAAVGDAARSRMLYSLMSGHARTATELALVAEVTPATASAHLHRLKSEQLVRVVAQGKHRYYSLDNERVADVLESLTVLAGRSRQDFVPNTPDRLRAARTCYDHLAGTLGVALHDGLFALGWLASDTADRDDYTVTEKGDAGLAALGIDVQAARQKRRRFAFACLDWSERRPHIGGAVGAALLHIALKKKWVAPDRETRAIRVTALGRRELAARLGVCVVSN